MSKLTFPNAWRSLLRRWLGHSFEQPRMEFYFSEPTAEEQVLVADLFRDCAYAQHILNTLPTMIQSSSDMLNVFRAYCEQYGVTVDYLCEWIRFPNTYSIVFTVRDEQCIQQLYELLHMDSQKPQYDTEWIFTDVDETGYFSLSEAYVTGELLAYFHDNGYVFHGETTTYHVTEYMQMMDATMPCIKPRIAPIKFKEACTFVNQFHRHHTAPQGHRKSISLRVGTMVIGVIIAGRPVSRHLDAEDVLEVTRCCVLEGFKNGISQLYARICQSAKAEGYQRIITYTLVNESGKSMRAAGFREDGLSKGGSWNCQTRQRIDKHPTIEKIRWQRVLNE